VLEELDEKKFRTDEVGYNARQTNRILEDLRLTGDLRTGVTLPGGGSLRIEIPSEEPLTDLKRTPDNEIIATVRRLQERVESVFLITKDISMRIKCDILGVKCQDYRKHRVSEELGDIYTGLQVVTITKDLMDSFFKDRKLPLELIDFNRPPMPNECIVLKNCGSGSGLGRVKDGELRKIVDRKDVWGLTPRNKEQQFAFDLLMDDSIKLTTLIGRAGTGKTLMAIAAAIKQTLEEQKYTKIIVTRPIQPLGRDIGYLPGTKEEKMEPWIQPIMDNMEHLFPKKVDLDMYFDQGIIEVEAITYIRGRSIPNAFVIVDEAQNLSVEEVKTIITRAGDGTKIVLTGDIEQIDNNLIDAVSNGLTNAVEKFKQYDIAGHITLLKGERSILSQLAASIL